MKIPKTVDEFSKWAASPRVDLEKAKEVGVCLIYNALHDKDEDWNTAVDVVNVLINEAKFRS